MISTPYLHDIVPHKVLRILRFMQVEIHPKLSEVSKADSNKPVVLEVTVSVLNFEKMRSKFEILRQYFGSNEILRSKSN